MITIIQEKMPDKASNQNRLPDVLCDEDLYITEEIFDELDKKLIVHFGEEYRKLANERRSRWNEKSSWTFQQL
jgi:hypothetical protein